MDDLITKLRAAIDDGWPPDDAPMAVALRTVVEIHEGSHECASLTDNCVWITGEPGDECETIRALAKGYGIEVD